MRFYQIAPLTLWVGRGAASGSHLFHDKFQLDELPDMVSLADAKLKDIVLPDSLSDFTEWIGGIAEPQAFGLQPRQQQCVDAGYSVSDVVLQAAPVSRPAAVAATPKNVAQAGVMFRRRKPAVVVAQFVSKARLVSVEVAAAKGRSNVAPLGVITQTLQYVAAASGGIAPRVMTACQVVGVVRQARSAAGTASAITHEKRLVVQGLELCGPAQSPVTAVQPASAPIPRLKGVARMAPA
ncbi:hypothetical protein FMUND_10705 [Fusarium mundagurra]|uniref:Uncharacterized protein n=1 Tax=Fusarium mundagurra TaxID=1567541 RepID=A0A8H6D8P0_9HYPO|nr:hypothetical protein FMUND_10705 [Fusarium mundagurra]